MGLATKKKIESRRSKAGSDAQIVDGANLVPRTALPAMRLPEGPALAETGYFQRTRMAPITR